MTDSITEGLGLYMGMHDASGVRITELLTVDITINDV